MISPTTCGDIIIVHLPTEDIDYRLIWFIFISVRSTQHSVSVRSTQLNLQFQFAQTGVLTSQTVKSSYISGVCHMPPFLLSPFTILISSVSEICQPVQRWRGVLESTAPVYVYLKFTVAVFQCTGTVIRVALDPYIFLYKSKILKNWLEC